MNRDDADIQPGRRNKTRILTSAPDRRWLTGTTGRFTTAVGTGHHPAGCV